jgi:hypothetical protein
MFISKETLDCIQLLKGYKELKISFQEAKNIKNDINQIAQEDFQLKDFENFEEIENYRTFLNGHIDRLTKLDTTLHHDTLLDLFYCQLQLTKYCIDNKYNYLKECISIQESAAKIVLRFTYKESGAEIKVHLKQDENSKAEFENFSGSLLDNSFSTELLYEESVAEIKSNFTKDLSFEAELVNLSGSSLNNSFSTELLYEESVAEIKSNFTKDLSFEAELGNLSGSLQDNSFSTELPYEESEIKSNFTKDLSFEDEFNNFGNPSSISSASDSKSSVKNHQRDTLFYIAHSKSLLEDINKIFDPKNQTLNSSFNTKEWRNKTLNLEDINSSNHNLGVKPHKKSYSKLSAQLHKPLYEELSSNLDMENMFLIIDGAKTKESVDNKDSKNDLVVKLLTSLERLEPSLSNQDVTDCLFNYIDNFKNINSEKNEEVITNQLDQFAKGFDVIITNFNLTTKLSDELEFNEDLKTAMDKMFFRIDNPDIKDILFNKLLFSLNKEAVLGPKKELTNSLTKYIEEFNLEDANSKEITTDQFASGFDVIITNFNLMTKLSDELEFNEDLKTAVDEMFFRIDNPDIKDSLFDRLLTYLKKLVESESIDSASIKSNLFNRLSASLKGLAESKSEPKKDIAESLAKYIARFNFEDINSKEIKEVVIDQLDKFASGFDVIITNCNLVTKLSDELGLDINLKTAINKMFSKIDNPKIKNSLFDRLSTYLKKLVESEPIDNTIIKSNLVDRLLISLKGLNKSKSNKEASKSLADYIDGFNFEDINSGETQKVITNQRDKFISGFDAIITNCNFVTKLSDELELNEDLKIALNSKSIADNIKSGTANSLIIMASIRGASDNKLTNQLGTQSATEIIENTRIFFKNDKGFDQKKLGVGEFDGINNPSYYDSKGSVITQPTDKNKTNFKIAISEAEMNLFLSVMQKAIVKNINNASNAADTNSAKTTSYSKWKDDIKAILLEERLMKPIVTTLGWGTFNWFNNRKIVADDKKISNIGKNIHQKDAIEMMMNKFDTISQQMQKSADLHFNTTKIKHYKKEEGGAKYSKIGQILTRDRRLDAAEEASKF